MPKALKIMLFLLFVLTLIIGGFIASRYFKVQNINQYDLSKKMGFEVVLPEYLPKGYKISSYTIKERTDYSPEQLALFYDGPGSNVIVFNQIPLSSQDPEYVNNFLEKTRDLFKNFTLREVSISNNKYPGLIGKVPSPSLDDTMDVLISWNDSKTRFSVWLNNPEGLSENELIIFVENLY